MLFNSIQFMIFFPIVTLIYYVIPKRARYLWLLVASYYFYMCWNARYVLLILASTLITYVSGILLETIKNNSNCANKFYKINADTLSKLVVGVSFCTNLWILCFFKYANFTIDLLKKFFSLVNIQLNVPIFDILLPVGISFYTFQALGYTMDVYRGEIQAERNLLKYALFVSFFPQLVAGPIERSKNLLKQFDEPKKFSYENAREGFLITIWGFFLKLVVANRIAIFVDTVYGKYMEYEGVYLIVATILFAVQIYCDFAGYSIIAMGTAKILGIDLMENFNAPYLSASVREFWKKWHISLTLWFKDYLYIPLGGSRKGKIRKYLNKLVVFLISGLWHGASLSFVAWGGLNGVYQIVEEIMQPVNDKIVKICKINTSSFCNRFIKALFTFILIDISWIFFRAASLRDAISIIYHIINVYNPWVLFDGSIYTCGLDYYNFILMLVTIMVVLICDIAKRKGVIIRNHVINQDFWARSVIIAASIVFILIFGVYGAEYDATGFIYFQF